MIQEPTVLLVGGPDSGKTNYLGRLWLAIRDHIGQLEADGTPHDLEYLNHLTQYFLQGNFAPHTPVESRNKVVIPVKISSETTTYRTNIIVPDVSGEEWKDIYRKRGWSNDWEDVISNVIGCLVFIRVDSDANISAIDWQKWSRLFQDPPSNNEEIPTQVILVDWLQCLRSVFLERSFSLRPRIGVIVSAYDLLPAEQKKLGPEAYLQANYPLFWQYINSIEDQFDVCIFGTSIASGDFKADLVFRDKFLSSEPGKAGYVMCQTKDDIQESKDITLPVGWAIGLEPRMSTKG